MIDRAKHATRARLAAGLAKAGYSDAMVAEAELAARSALSARRRPASIRRATVFAGRAVVWPASGRAQLVPIEAPYPERGELAVELEATCISPGTERAHYLRLPNARPELPFVPGYSGAGRVLAVGAGVETFVVGDLVALPRVRHASVATVSAAAAYRVPPGIQAAEASFAYLAVIAGYGVSCGALTMGESVCVMGLGPIGAAAQRLARMRGAGSTTVVAATRRRETTAVAGGADRFLTVAADAAEIGRLDVPLVIDATGDPDAVALAVAAAAPGGRVVLLGSSRGTPAALSVAEVRRKRLTLVGAHVSTIIKRGGTMNTDLVRDGAEAFLAGLRDGLISVVDLVGDPVDPRDADDFYRHLASSERSVAHFDWSALPTDDRARNQRIWSRPTVRARGLTYGRAPLPPTAELAAHVTRELADPFRGSSGRLRIGLFGCGDIGIANAAAIGRAPNAELVASFDPDANLARDISARFGGRVARSPEAIFDHADVDAVFLAVPHHLHAPLAIAAAEAGLHVLVEKPLANNLASAVAIAEATRRAGVTLTTCLPFRYEPAVVAAHHLFRSGAVGQFAGATVSYRADKPASYWVSGYSNRSSSDWRRSRTQSGGGVLAMNLPHYIDLIRYIGGVNIESVTAVEAPGGDEIEDAIAVAVTYCNGCVGAVTGDAAVRGGLPTEFHLKGSEGYVTLEPTAMVYAGHTVTGLTGARWHALPVTPTVDVRAIFVSRFATALDQGDPPDVGVEDSLAVQAFMEAAYRSSRTGERVRPADLLVRSLG